MIKVLVNATVVTYYNVLIYQTNMSYTLHLHNGTRQLYFNERKHAYNIGNNKKKIFAPGWRGPVRSWDRQLWLGQGGGDRTELRIYYRDGFHFWKQNPMTFLNGN